jgi:hypothetical protein
MLPLLKTAADGKVHTKREAVELHLKAGRAPFDVNSVYLKTGKRFQNPGSKIKEGSVSNRT